MGRFSRKLTRSAYRTAVQFRKKVERKRISTARSLMSRWLEVTKKFPNHRFYVASMLPEEAAKARAEGLRQLVAVPVDSKQPDGRWAEIRSLGEPLQDDLGDPYLFGIIIGPGNMQPIKVHPNVTVSVWVPPVEKAIVTPEEAGVRLIATPEEAVREGASR